MSAQVLGSGTAEAEIERLSIPAESLLPEPVEADKPTNLK
jgi:hypothetical protein